MGIHNPGYAVKEHGRQAFTVPVASGDYASERLTFGVVSSGVIARGFLGLTALIEADASGAPCPSNVTVEVWLPMQPDGSKSADQFTDADYFFSGDCLVPAGTTRSITGVNTVMYGMGTWPLSAYNGVQLRVKSGGQTGTVTIDASAW